MMHRAFRASTIQRDHGEADFAGLRAFLRSLGLQEREGGGGYLYAWLHPDGGTRHFATVSCTLRQVTVYLYPDALGRSRGHAAHLYRTLDLAGFGMGSKLGPSIAFGLEDEARLHLFTKELAALFEQ